MGIVAPAECTEPTQEARGRALGAGPRSSMRRAQVTAGPAAGRWQEPVCLLLLLEEEAAFPNSRAGPPQGERLSQAQAG